jgi:hypothetical protein
MIKKSFRVIDIASKLRRKKMGWMKESGSNWPWHITFWDHSSDRRPEYLTVKDTFEGENQIKILSEGYSYVGVSKLSVKNTVDEDMKYELI